MVKALLQSMEKSIAKQYGKTLLQYCKKVWQYGKKVWQKSMGKPYCKKVWEKPHERSHLL